MEKTTQNGAQGGVLFQHDGILESVSLVRIDRFGNEVLVIYAVPEVLTLDDADRLTFESCGVRIGATESLPTFGSGVTQSAAKTPVQIVLINAIPRDATGHVDEASLLALPVLDASLIASWSDKMELIPQLEKFAVVSALNHRKQDSLHRADVLQGIDGAGTSLNSTAQQPHVEPARSGGELDTQLKSIPAEVEAGGQLLSDQLDSQYSLCLANLLYRAVQISPEKGIKYIDQAGKEFFQTYPELLELASTVLSGMQANGLKAGDKVLLQCSDNRDFLAVFWACALGGLVPVPMTVAPEFKAGNAICQKLVNSWEMFEHSVIVASDNLADGLGLLGEAYSQFAPRILFFSELRQNDSTVAVRPTTDIAADELALLLLTSGSTGTPKAVMHTHQTLINRCAATSAMNRFDREDVSLNWMPLDHVGGIVMFHLRDVYNACSQIQVATSWILEEPLRWLDQIDFERASITWAPNFAFALINDRSHRIADRRRDLSCMRFVLNGGEAVVAKTARRFLALLLEQGLPMDAMKPAWGMSETASGVCYSHKFTFEGSADSNAVVEVGRPIPNTSIRIVDEHNRVLGEGEKGSLQVKGASVTPGYYLNPEENEQAFTRDGWFDTGDAGVICDGCLTIAARIKDEIIINGVNHLAAEIEAVAETVTGVVVSFTAACAVRRGDSDTDALAIFFSPADGETTNLADLLNHIQQTVLSDAGVMPEFLVPLASSQIPKTNIGKIQRSLLKKDFEKGRFDELLKQSELLQGKNIIPGWFFSKRWNPKVLNTANLASAEKRHYLIFRDGAGLGESLCQKLSSTGEHVVSVEIGNEYKALRDNHFMLNPGSKSDYLELMQTLHRAGLYPDVILHCWTYAGADQISDLQSLCRAQNLGVFSLLHLLQALSTVNVAARSTQLYTISRGLQQLPADDQPLNPNATLLGLLKTVPLEFDWLTARHIDLDSCSKRDDLSIKVDVVLDELACTNPDDEVVYRNGQRFSWQLDAERFNPETQMPCPLKRGGIVLVTGGLGGVGAALAQFLGRQFDSRLILIGRSQLPARELWAGIQEQGGALAERIDRYIKIEETGAEVIYSATDVLDVQSLEKIVESAESRWDDELNAVFHLAVSGDIGDRWGESSRYEIDNESVDAYTDIFNSKVYASWQLAELVSRRKQTLMVSFASVIGVFGAARYASYAAAHTFLSQMTRHYDNRMPGRFHQFDWSVWQDLGLSKHDPSFAADFYQSLGYMQIPTEIGIDSLMAGLCHREVGLVVGLDADKWPVRRHLPFESQLLLKIVGCFTATQPLTDVNYLVDGVGLLEGIKDGFNHPLYCELLQMKQLPETVAGIPDVASLKGLIEHQMSDQDSKPATEIERKIASLWCDILSVSNPARGVSFFRLGGNSLTAAQLSSRMKQTFNVGLELRDLFNFATIADLAEFVEKNQIMDNSHRGESTVDIQQDNFSSSSAGELLENIDQMSDAEVAELLKAMQQEGDSN